MPDGSLVSELLSRAVYCNSVTIKVLSSLAALIDTAQKEDKRREMAVTNVTAIFEKLDLV